MTTTISPPSVLNLNSTAIEIPLTFKQDEISEEFSYTGFVPVELPYFVESTNAVTTRRWGNYLQYIFLKFILSSRGKSLLESRVVTFFPD